MVSCVTPHFCQTTFTKKVQAFHVFCTCNLSPALAARNETNQLLHYTSNNTLRAGFCTCCCTASGLLKFICRCTCLSKEKQIAYNKKKRMRFLDVAGFSSAPLVIGLLTPFLRSPFIWWPG